MAPVISTAAGTAMLRRTCANPPLYLLRLPNTNIKFYSHSPRTACGFYTSPGFSAAVSQNLYGVGPGEGAGPACGGCWLLTAKTVSSDHLGPPSTATSLRNWLTSFIDRTQAETRSPSLGPSL